ncbi:MAG: hypothetical protein RMK19_05135 [Bacteroidia bacterium]|nr:hypothetical protein [Bacteroidia bacterium]MDW8015376.1 hypothetical protein [Bacteroidia bacterium]
MFLDAFYEALERWFRQQYNQVVQKLNENALYPADLYKIEQCSALLSRTLQALGSFSVWGFYGGVGVGIILLLSVMV